jgi:hypothetical protein
MIWLVILKFEILPMMTIRGFILKTSTESEAKDRISLLFLLTPFTLESTQVHYRKRGMKIFAVSV